MAPCACLRRASVAGRRQWIAGGWAWSDSGH